MCTSFASKLSCLPSSPPSPTQLPARPIRALPPQSSTTHLTSPVASVPRSRLNPLTFTHPLTSTPRCPLCGAYICHNLAAAIIVPCVHWTCMTCFESHTDAKLSAVPTIKPNSNNTSTSDKDKDNTKATPTAANIRTSTSSTSLTTSCSTAFDAPSLFDTMRAHHTCPISRCNTPVTSFWPATADSLEEELMRLREHQALITLQRQRREREEEEEEEEEKAKAQRQEQEQEQGVAGSKLATGLGEVLQLGKGPIFGTKGSGAVAGSGLKRRDTDASMLTGTATHCSTGSEAEGKVVQDVRKMAVRVDSGFGAAGEKVRVEGEVERESMVTRQMGVVSYMRERRAAKEALMKEG